MSKKHEKALNEKLNVKLPENLLTENILSQLDSVEQEAKVVEMPRKKSTAKRLIPIAASLALVVGLLGVYFGMGLDEEANGPQFSGSTADGDITEVMRYQSYDKIYDKFDTLREEYEEAHKGNFIDILWGYVTDDAVEFGETNGSSADSDMAVPEASVEGNQFASGSTATNSNNGTANADDEARKEFAETNTQEKGVDEGDIIKTDGDYLYIANADGKMVSIVDVKSEEMNKVAQIDVDKTEIVKELYISGNKLMIVGYMYPDDAISEDAIIKIHDNMHYVFEDTDDGYKHIATYGINQYDTFVKVYNIADRTNPKLVTEYSQQGSYENSRMIGTKLYCISTYRVNIGDDDYRDKCIPETEVYGEAEKIAADCIHFVEESASTTYAVITTLDVENGTKPASEAILGDCNELYASAKGLFISETSYNKETYEEVTKIYRFEYTDTGVNYKCMGKAPGHINNQFSMSYDGEYFRIATTLNKVEVEKYGESAEDTAISMSIDKRVNNLYILNNNMQTVGKVENLAEGESIKSVRFVGNMAYVVTFRQTDPLFVIDLSDPENPTVKSELKIPGFSEYLHPIADGLLVGVGQDGTYSGTNGDCKVSLFDVSNPCEPKESSLLRVTDGEGYCYSNIANNHKLYIKLSETEFAVPFNINWFVRNGIEEHTMSSCYIHYKLENNELCEAARYYLGGEKTEVMGATYVEDTFYAIVNDYADNDTYIVAFDLATNEEIGTLSLAEAE